MSKRKMRDPVNQPNLEFAETRGEIRLGLLKSREWISDPKRLSFSLARYKFVAKMLSGRSKVLEIGCADAFAAPIIMQEVGSLTVTDYDEEFINDALKRRQPEYPFDAMVHNFIEGPIGDTFDAVYLLDVLEHIPPAHEARFLDNILQCLMPGGAMIVGIPSLESQAYASEGSRAGHINCKSAPDLKKTLEHYFHSVFMFSMNDEVVHTGYHKLAHYLLAVCAHKR